MQTVSNILKSSIEAGREHFKNTIIQQFHAENLSCEFVSFEPGNGALSVHGDYIFKIEEYFIETDTMNIKFRYNKLSKEDKLKIGVKNFETVKEFANFYYNELYIEKFPKLKKTNDKIGVFENVIEENEASGSIHIMVQDILENEVDKYLVEKMAKYLEKYEMSVEYVGKIQAKSSNTYVHVNIGGIPMFIENKDHLKLYSTKADNDLVATFNEGPGVFYNLKDFVDFYNDNNLHIYGNKKLDPARNYGVFETASPYNFSSFEYHIKHLRNVSHLQFLTENCDELIKHGLNAKIIDADTSVISICDIPMFFRKSYDDSRTLLFNLTKEPDLRTFLNLSNNSNGREFLNIKDVIKYFKQHHLESYKKLKPGVQYGVFEKIKSFKEFNK